MSGPMHMHCGDSVPSARAYRHNSDHGVPELS